MEKLNDITSAVLNQLMKVCGDDCDINNDIIDTPSFDCDPDTPTTVIYLARLSGTSVIDSEYLISVIQDWVNDGASVIVAGVRMTVGTQCAVNITSLDELACEPPFEPPSETSTTQQPTHKPTTDVNPRPSPKPTPEVTNDPTITDPMIDDSTDPTSSSGTDNTIAIIGGVVAIILIIAITAVLLGIIVLKCCRHGDVSIKNALEK